MIMIKFELESGKVVNIPRAEVEKLMKSLVIIITP